MRIHRSVTAAWLAAIAAATFAVGASSPSCAQDAYPSKQIHLVIPYTAGGATDVLGRVTAQALGDRLGQQVVVENRPGAGSVLATGQVAKATPDGYTLLFGTLAHAINATMYKKLPYDPIDDLQFVGKIGQLAFALIVSPKLDVPNLQAAVNLMKASPGKYEYASAGVGTPMHLGFALLNQLTGTQAVHVPYKGESVALTDLLGARVAFMLCAIPTCASRIRDGQVKAIAVSSAQRSTLVPAIPSAPEAGVPGFETYSWFTISAPKGTPRPVVDRLSTALNEVLKDPAYRAKVNAMGTEVDASSTPESTLAFVKSEIDKWRPIVIQTGATPE